MIPCSQARTGRTDGSNSHRFLECPQLGFLNGIGGSFRPDGAGPVGQPARQHGPGVVEQSAPHVRIIQGRLHRIGRRRGVGLRYGWGHERLALLSQHHTDNLSRRQQMLHDSGTDFDNRPQRRYLPHTHPYETSPATMTRRAVVSESEAPNCCLCARWRAELPAGQLRVEPCLVSNPGPFRSVRDARAWLTIETMHL